MHLFLGRLNDSISLDEIEPVAQKIDSIFDIKSELVSEPFNKTVARLDLKEFGEMLYKHHLEQGTPFICIAYTRETMTHGRILGEAMESQRVAFVRWSDRTDETANSTAHELGHIFGIQGHCDKCLMLPYYKETDLQGKTVKELFCDNCRRTIETSWSYTRVKSTSKQPRPSNNEPSTHRNTPPTPEPRRHSPIQATRDPFPDISTLDPQNPYDYLYRVLKFYKFGGG